MNTTVTLPQQKARVGRCVGVRVGGDVGGVCVGGVCECVGLGERRGW